MALTGKHGITEETAKNILLGAGTFHENLKWNTQEKKWDGTIIGATTGGGKVSIEGEYKDLDIDGALVLFEGQTVKLGGKASMEFNLAEIKDKTINIGTHFKKTDSDVDEYDLYVDKPNIEKGDYLENFGYVGKTADGKKDIIVIFESALCKSAFEIEGKNKDQSSFKITLEAYAKYAEDSALDTLPVRIYYPGATSIDE